MRGKESEGGWLLEKKSAEKVDRTPDLMIFSHTLSQLSYLGFYFLSLTTLFVCQQSHQEDWIRALCTGYELEMQNKKGWKETVGVIEYPVFQAG